MRHNKIGTFVSRTASIENSKSISSHIYEQSSTNGSDGYEPSAENVFKTIHHFDQHSFGNNHCDHHSTNECSVCLFSISLKLKLEIIHMNRLYHTLTHRSTDRPKAHIATHFECALARSFCRARENVMYAIYCNFHKVCFCVANHEWPIVLQIGQYRQHTFALNHIQYT